MSALDGRIRKLAREEAAALFDGVKSPSAEMESTNGTAHAPDLQQQITDLHEHLHHAATTISRLEARIDVLEKTADQTSQEQPTTVRRTRRKTSDE